MDIENSRAITEGMFRRSMIKERKWNYIRHSIKRRQKRVKD